jgi:gliding motility-associated-like protein
VEVSFDAAVLRFGAEFKGWVFNSDDPSRLKQQVEPGNATFRYAGDGLSVRTVVGGDLLVFVETSPNPFTPNGDGINDELSLSFKVREVAVQRSIQMKIYDLSGQLVRELTDEAAKTGAYLKTWDGRDDREERVSPGIYIYRISLEADERREEKVGTIAVVY